MNTTALRHPIQPLAPRTPGHLVAEQLHNATVDRVATLLRRVSRFDLQGITAFPAALLEHMQCGVREWTDDEPAPMHRSPLLDSLASFRFNRSTRMGVGRRW